MVQNLWLRLLLRVPLALLTLDVKSLRQDVMLIRLHRAFGLIEVGREE